MAKLPATSGLRRPEPAPAIDLLAYYYLLREKWWLVLLCLLFTVGLGAAYVFLTKPTYETRAVVQVEQAASNVMNIKEVTPEEFKSLEAIKTVEGALASQSLMLRVIRVNKLDTNDPDFAAAPGEPPLTESQLLDIMDDKVEVKLRRGTRLIEITVRDTQPQRARKLARSFVDEYIKLGLEQRSEVSQVSSEGLIAQGQELKARLEKTERELQDYREKSGTVSLEEKQNILADKLKELNKSIAEAKNTRIKLEADLPTLHQAKSLEVEELLALGSVSSAPEIQETLKLITRQEAEFSHLKKRYLQLHPKYLQAQEQLRGLRQSLEKAVRKTAAMGVNAHESARETEVKLQAALQEQETLGLNLSRVAIPYGVLLREAQADRALYESVLTRVRETKVSETLEKSNVRLIEDPVVPKWPVKPKKKRALAAAVAAGLMLGVTLVVLIQAFDNSLRSVDQAEQTLGLPSLSAVPEAKGRSRKNPLVLIHQPASREAEAFRCLRTALSLLPAGAPKSVLFTSAVPAEGKSYCSANYAVSLAQQGMRTLIIDADLRRPGLGRLFPASQEKGLSDWLSGRASFDEACQSLEVENLSIMPAGTKIANPAELLGNAKFPDLLKEALGKFDRVVLDTAPINAVSDTLLLVEHVDAVTFVVRARKTPARALLRALHLLETAEKTPAGFVLNRLPSRLANYYYYDEGSYSSAGVYGT